MSQPFNRGASVPAPGVVDQSLGEFWVTNPWDIVDKGHNLSAYERKRAFLNVQGKDFLDISFLTGADSDGDGRSVVAGDFRNDGRLDLVVRQVGGGPVLLFENQFPKAHYLTVSLRGMASNKLGIGARLTATVSGRELTRELYPQNSFRSQMPSRVHFGLGDATRIDRLTVRWPSGAVQMIDDLAADRHVVITEGKTGPGAVETVTPGQVIHP
ncbi:MAG: CRTAC1 family protein [Isosphaerales bacterium]